MGGGPSLPHPPSHWQARRGPRPQAAPAPRAGPRAGPGAAFRRRTRRASSRRGRGLDRDPAQLSSPQAVTLLPGTPPRGPWARPVRIRSPENSRDRDPEVSRDLDPEISRDLNPAAGPSCRQRSHGPRPRRRAGGLCRRRGPDGRRARPATRRPPGSVVGAAPAARRRLRGSRRTVSLVLSRLGPAIP